MVGLPLDRHAGHMNSVIAEHLAEERHRELRIVAQTRPRPIPVPPRWRAALGRRLVAWGLRLCLPGPKGGVQRVWGNL